MTTTGSRRPPRPPQRRPGRASTGSVSTTSRRRFDARTRSRRLRTAGHVALLLVVVGAVGAVTWLVGWSSVLALETVRVTGATGELRADVLAAADAPVGRPLVRVDTDAVQRRVAAVPEVADAQVSRSWPRGLTVRVEPRVPVAVVADGESWRLVDAEGVAYTRVPTAPGELPEIGVGAGEEDQAVRAEAVAVVTALPPELAVAVVSVRAESVDDVRLELVGGAEVVWGSAERSARKAQVLAVLQAQQAAVYDVSAPDRPSTRAS